jgi:hypothetical protein
VCLLCGTFCPHSVFMCFVWIWEQMVIISLYSINWLVFITETECVYCAVRSAHTVYLSVLCGSENKQRLFHCTALTNWFLSAFENCEKQLLASSCLSVRLSVRRSVRLCICTEQLGSHQTDFDETWHLSFFRKSVEKIYVSLKSDKNNGYFTRRSLDIFDNISLNSS